MDGTRFEPPVFRLRRSGWLRWYLHMVHLLGIASVACTGFPLALRLALASALWLSWAWSLSCWRSGHWTPGGTFALSVDGTWWHWRDDGGTCKYRPVGILLVHRWLVCVRLRAEEEGRVLTLVVFPDSLAAGEARRLRVWLRLRGR